MEKILFDGLCELGADPTAGAARFVGNEALYQRYLIKFLDDGTMAEITAAWKAEDWTGMLKAAHTFKGLTGNLSLDSLYKISAEIVTALRAEDTNTAKRGYEELLPLYHKFCSILKKMKDAQS